MWYESTQKLRCEFGNVTQFTCYSIIESLSHDALRNKCALSVAIAVGNMSHDDFFDIAIIGRPGSFFLFLLLLLLLLFHNLRSLCLLISLLRR